MSGDNSVIGTNYVGKIIKQTNGTETNIYLFTDGWNTTGRSTSVYPYHDDDISNHLKIRLQPPEVDEILKMEILLKLRLKHLIL